MKALGRGWVPASLLRAPCQWADSNLREAGASDLTLGPLTLCTGESGGALRLGAGTACRPRRVAEARLVPSGPRWVVGRTEPQALGDSPGRRAAPEPCRRVPVRPQTPAGVQHPPRGGLGLELLPCPNATGSAHCKNRTRECESTEPRPRPATPPGALDLSALGAGCPLESTGSGRRTL